MNTSTTSTVWVVVWNNGKEYEDYQVALSGVFSTKEKAKMFIKNTPQLSDFGCTPRYEIKEMELNPVSIDKVYL